MNLSTHFTLAELTASQTAVRRGIDNKSPEDVVKNLEHLALGLEGVRMLLGCPLIISSGYRSPELNTAVGGARDSQHKLGLAADFIAPGFGSPIQVARAIAASGLKFDQLICEGNWCHVSFAATPRRQVLTATFKDGRVYYSPGLA